MLEASAPVKLPMRPILMGLPVGVAAALPPVVAVAPAAAVVGVLDDFDDDEHAAAVNVPSANEATASVQRRGRLCTGRNCTCSPYTFQANLSGPKTEF
jgi:hypothetical protein